MSLAKIIKGSLNDSQALVFHISELTRIILMLSKILCGNFFTWSLAEDFQAASFFIISGPGYTDTFSNRSVFKSIHFGLRIQMFAFP